jgi:hypothetical protein
MARQPALRNSFGQAGYDAFTCWWTREAHLDLYFDLLRQTAAEKFGSVDWDQEACHVPAA